MKKNEPYELPHTHTVHMFHLTNEKRKKKGDAYGSLTKDVMEVKRCEKHMSSFTMGTIRR